MDAHSLSIDWIAAKQAEAEAIAYRREIEDLLTKELGIQETDEGTKNFEASGYKIKVVGKMNRKVDGDKLQEIAAEAGLSDHLGELFRWKPEINMTAWKRADNSITEVLQQAITTTPGRPSYTITQE